MSFKVGDRVIVTKYDPLVDDGVLYNGAIGTIIDFDDSKHWPVMIELDVPLIFTYPGGEHEVLILILKTEEIEYYNG